MNRTSESSSTLDARKLAAVACDVEADMQAFLQGRPLPQNLKDAVAYSLLGGGKRMRPVLVIWSAEALGGAAADAMPAASAIELIHCFSLVHDDLPAMDDDDLRRGRPTLHKHAGEAMAILAGDLMMGLASQSILERVRPETLAGQVLGELIAGTNAMIAGQVYDTLGGFEAGLTDAQKLETIHINKTGALIRCSCRMGALCAGADAAALAALTAYGDAIGLMFQVVDDVLDITQTTERLGKTAGKDVQQDKLTYPAVHGMDRSLLCIKELREKALAALEPLGPPADPLRQLCDYLAIRTH